MSKENFFSQVYEVARLIPKGRLTSYGAIANYLGTKSSARMVGWAMNGCPDDVPAHRVLNRNGLLSGKHHFGSPDEMQRRIEAEGIKVERDQVINFQKYFWDPNLELSL